MSHSNLSTPPQSHSQTPQQRRPRSATSSAPPPPHQPPIYVPTLNELLDKRQDEVACLSISTLKAILYQNRVNISVGVLEKEDLVRKVVALIVDERQDRELKQQEELKEARRREDDDVQDAQDASAPNLDDESNHTEEESVQSSTANNKNVNKDSRPHTTDIPSSHEGLCVVCQDEHANMAIIDCGYGLLFTRVFSSF